MQLRPQKGSPSLRAERDALVDENARLRRAVDELRVLNEVAAALGAAADLDAMLRTLVGRALHAIGAEQGVIVLVEERPDGPADRGSTLVRTEAFTTLGEALHPDETLLGWRAHHRHPLALDDPRVDPRFAGVAWPDVVRTVLAVPMLAGGRLVGALTLYNKRGAPAFTPNDARLLAILAAQSAQVVEKTRHQQAQARAEVERAEAEAERERALRIFGQHTAPSVVAELLRDGVAEGPGRRQPVCVMFLDLRGYTARAEGWPPERVVAYLNAVFEVAVDAVSRHGGFVHQLLGDGFMAVFGAPLATESDCADAVAASLAIVRDVEAACASGRLPPTRVGLGLHAGEVVAGMVGSAVHREYKVTGDVVNVAARIEKLNKPLGSQLLVSDAVWAHLGGARPPADDLGAVALDGRAAPVRLYKLA